jgi:Mlc titration factor MtfA (ptsG expression regulator)
MLVGRVPGWERLEPPERERVEGLTVQLLVDLHWEAAHGFELTEQIEVTIAAEAALLLLGLPDDSFRKVRSVLVHPTTVVLTGEHSQVPGIVSDGPMPILGQADLHGPVLIVWDAVQGEARHPGSGHRVVLHEFAHRLDMLTGDADGLPPMAAEAAERWIQVCTAVYEQVATGRGSPVLREYAGVNPAEFFAVATEVFFDAPRLLLAAHPDLYAVLAGYYGQDPAARAVRAPMP